MEELNSLSERVFGLAIQVHREPRPAEREKKQLKIRLGNEKSRTMQRNLRKEIKISGFSVFSASKGFKLFTY